MEHNIYTGSSESFGTVVDGYLDYAQAVLSARAFPDIRDGLKPGARRILYTSFQNKVDYLVKCGNLVGKAMELHPHSDQSIYNSLCLMTDKNGNYNTPFYKGQGNLGNCFSSASPGAMRYSKAMLSQFAINNLFDDIDFVKFVPAEEGDGTEPEVLPATYPVVLVNGTNGLGVGVSADITSFNFSEVLDMTIKYLQNGELTVDDLLVPDFPTGGVLVRNDEELAKIMLTGRGKLKVRAKVEISGKEILVKEVPTGRSCENIQNLIKKADIKEISRVDITYGHNAPALMSIECKTKKCVEYVLMELYRRGILQNNHTANILVMNGSTPLLIGVHEIIQRWVNWRRSVVKVKYETSLSGLKKDLIPLGYMVRLTSNEEWRDTYVNTVLKQSKSDAEDYLVSIFEDIPHEVCDWIYGRSLTSFRKAGKYQNRYDNLEVEIGKIEDILSDLDAELIRELEVLKNVEGKNYARKTEVTYKDYKFSKVEDAEVVDTSFCVYTLTKEGFLMKTRDMVDRDDVLCSIPADASSILVGFDNFGRVLKVPGAEIPFTPYGEYGVYLPKYFDVSFQENYRVMYLCLLDGKTRMLIYKDGFVGFFDTSEWVGKKVIKVINQGVDLHVYDQLVDIVEPDDIPEYLMVADFDSRERCRLGLTLVDSIPVRSRRSRAKIFYGNEVNIGYWHGFSAAELMPYLRNSNNYFGKMRVLRDDDLQGDSEIIQEGRYALWGYEKSED